MDRLTVWCAQHDEKTLQPAKARAVELPSLSGLESTYVGAGVDEGTQPSPGGGEGHRKRGRLV